MLILHRNPEDSPQWKLFRQNSGRFETVSFAEGLRGLYSCGPQVPATASFETGNLGIPPEEPLEAPFGGTKILCVGRNYRPHAEELGNPIPAEPLWFTKPPSSLLAHGGTVLLPSGVGRVDFEGEMALLIGKTGKSIRADSAWEYIAGVCPALDITARELQKKDGQWTRAKGFDTFCPLGPGWVPFHPDWASARLTTELNDKVVQQDSLTSLIFSIPRLIEHISDCMTLCPGDVILTGTPAGVGPLAAGDRLRVSLESSSLIVLEVEVANRSTP